MRRFPQSSFREELMDEIGPAVHAWNDRLHQGWRDTTEVLNADYLRKRKELLDQDESTKYSRGLVLSFEPAREANTGLQIAYIRWRKGPAKTQKNAARGLYPKVTHGTPVGRVNKGGPRGVQEYTREALLAVLGKAPKWEQNLVLATERAIRPIRDAMKAHEEGQRVYLHGPILRIQRLKIKGFT